MPLERVPATDIAYYLIAFDNKGKEREEGTVAPGGQLSRRLLD